MANRTTSLPLTRDGLVSVLWVTLTGYYLREDSHRAWELGQSTPRGKSILMFSIMVILSRYQMGSMFWIIWTGYSPKDGNR